MADEPSTQSFGKNFIIAVLILGGTLMFLMFMGRAAQVANHTTGLPWP
jgi:hypothetical protein